MADPSIIIDYSVFKDTKPKLSNFEKNMNAALATKGILSKTIVWDNKKWDRLENAISGAKENIAAGASTGEFSSNLKSAGVETQAGNNFALGLITTGPYLILQGAYLRTDRNGSLAMIDNGPILKGDYFRESIFANQFNDGTSLAWGDKIANFVANTLSENSPSVAPSGVKNAQTPTAAQPKPIAPAAGSNGMLDGTAETGILKGTVPVEGKIQIIPPSAKPPRP